MNQIGATAAVLFVGNATRDSHYFVDHLPQEDEVCAVYRRLDCLGGRGVVPALVTAALGVRASICTVIGSDARDEFESFLSVRGVDTSPIKWDRTGTATTQYVAFIGSDTHTTVAVAHPPELDWTPTSYQERALEDASLIYLSTNNLSFNLHLLARTDPSHQILMHNLGLRLPTRPDYIDPMLSRATYLIGNRVEFGELSGLTGRTAVEILSASPTLKAVIVTEGRSGARVYEKGKEGSRVIGGRAVRSPVSPVGAGDSFAAGVLATIAMGGSLDDGVVLGAELGATAVESALSYPDLEQVAAFMRFGT